MSSLTSTLFLTSILLGSQAKGYDLLEAIAQVESGGDHQAVGDNNRARGAWQMHKLAWEDAGLRLGERWHFSYAHDKGIGRRHAEAYLQLVGERLTKHLKRKPTNQEIYACWRLGVGGFIRYGSYSRLPENIRESCERVNNLTSK